MAALLALVVGAWAGPPAGPEAVEAERVRLAAEATALAGKNAWSGVLRVVGDLEALATPEAPLPVDLVILGARAELAEGDVLAAVHRLQALLAGPARGGWAWVEAGTMLADLEARYGTVRITVYEGRPRLERPEMPLAPDERAVIEHVRRRISRERRFLGMLPAGVYGLGDVGFEVVAGAPIVDVRVGTPPQSGSSSHGG